MAKGMPSVVALLGLLAVAGYQNRDKLGQMLNGAGNQTNDPNNPGRAQNGLGGLLNGLGDAFTGANAGSVLNGGLGDLVDRFRQSGRGDKADSWIGTGENAQLDNADLEATLGEDTLVELSEKTGLSRAELLDRLSKTLPDAVNQMTPDGYLPVGQTPGRTA